MEGKSEEEIEEANENFFDVLEIIWRIVERLEIEGRSKSNNKKYIVK